MRVGSFALSFSLLALAYGFQTPLSGRVSPRQQTLAPSAVLRGGTSDVSLSPTQLHSASPDASTEWTKKRLHNTAVFRSIAILFALLAAGFSSKSPIKLLPVQAVASIHMLSFATWFGMVAYTTFVAGIIMFKNLPRQTFGRLQSKLFPKYFSISSFALVIQLVTLKSLSGMKASIAHNSAKSLGIAFLMTLINQFYLEPTSTINMLERYDLDENGEQESDRYKKLKASFGKFHGMSSLANLIALCAGVAHAVFLSSTLVVV
jgi:hypothetical protein